MADRVKPWVGHCRDRLSTLGESHSPCVELQAALLAEQHNKAAISAVAGCFGVPIAIEQEMHHSG